MSGKNKFNSPVVFSTDPDFKPFYEEESEKLPLATTEQKLKIQLDKKHRAGKAVTLISGFVGKLDDLETLGKKIKTFCGTGGSVKNGEIIVQGDNRDKIFIWLKNNGYNLSKKI